AEESGKWDARLDDVLTSRVLGYPIMLLLLGAVFWVTLAGANVPSEFLAAAFAEVEGRLAAFCTAHAVPPAVRGILVEGIYRTVTWVVAVMLPPMAIFFPLFTLLEESGYLPRVAFNVDRFFKAAGGHGKQALTMAMGLGCNAAGVVACRIIEAPRERLVAILTNVFTPCNGRFPTLLLLASLLTGGAGPAAAAVVAGVLLAGVAATWAVSFVLTRTCLRGLPSAFAMELPPYRPPRWGRVVVRAAYDRTLVLLRRAVAVAAPAGAVLWLLANVRWEGASLLAHLAAILEPLGRALGLDGFILAAFLLGLPANEIVLPILLMGYLATGAMVEIGSADLRGVLLARGWDGLTMLNVMLFSVLHFPCATTLLTVFRETGSCRWTLLTAGIPAAVAGSACFLTTQVARALNW
ncbi:MAG: ferrous iron transporter B, partial [Firmicutes bacterium]|nr:ferrous iron transporter B [Bacillota bacterium]